MKQFCFILIIFLAISCEKQTFEIDTEFHVILIMGQSNTLAGKGLDPTIDSVSDGILQLGRHEGNNLEIIDAVEPLHHHTYGGDRIGFGLTFAKVLNEYWDKTKDIIIIPCGKGGTGFGTNYWNKGDELYEDALYRTNYILSTFQNSKITAILWHQGEDDIGKPEFQQNLDNFIDYIRKDLGYDSIPFILGGMVPNWVNEKESRINQQNILKNTPERLGFVGYADPTIPFIIENKNYNDEEIHYDAEAQRILGQRYFNEFQRIMELFP
jgi:hypothetical protein